MILGLTLILHKSKQNIDNAEIVLNNLQDTFVVWAGLSLQRKNKEAAVVEILLKGKKVHRAMGK